MTHARLDARVLTLICANYSEAHPKGNTGLKLSPLNNFRRQQIPINSLGKLKIFVFKL